VVKVREVQNFVDRGREVVGRLRMKVGNWGVLVVVMVVGGSGELVVWWCCGFGPIQYLKRCLDVVGGGLNNGRWKVRSYL
jgi:hypothetical protein